MLNRLLEICVCAALFVLPGSFAAAADFAPVAALLKKQGLHVESLKNDEAIQLLEVASERSGQRAQIQIGRYADERDAKWRFESLRSAVENPGKPPFQVGDGIVWVSSRSHWAFITTFGRVFLLINASGMPPEVARELAVEFEKLFAEEARVRNSKR